MAKSILRQGMRVCGMGALLAFGACADDKETQPIPQEPSVTGVELLKSSIEHNQNPEVSESAIFDLVQANQAFAFDLYRWLSDKKADENVFYSPHSIIQAMGMVSVGARADTLAEFDAVFYRQNFAGQSWHEALNRLSLDVVRGRAGQTGANPFNLNISNSIWGIEGYPYGVSFLDILAEHYGAGLNIVDFVSNPEGARQKINAWVAKKTFDLIKNLLPQGVITSDTRLVLTNTIYFKADWLSQFDANLTYEGEFKSISGQVANVKFMSQLERFPYAEVDGHQILELPYKGESQSMVFILPQEGADFRSFEQDLDAEQFQRYISALSPKLGYVTVPRFKMDSATSLKDVLKDLGLKTAFSSEANFNGIADGKGLSISDVLHQGVVIVDEKGTEAAAATAVVVGETSAPIAEFSVKLNRPFVFAIRDRSNGELLFVGRYVVAAENP